VKHTLASIGAAFALVVLAGKALAGGGAQVDFSPQSANASVGEKVTVDLTVANVAPDPGLASYDLTLRFDPAVVRLESFSDAGFVTSGKNVVICVPGLIDNVGGSANATCTAIPLFGQPGVSTAGPVVLLHASLTALAAGTSPLTLSGSLSGPKGTPISASFGSGSIRVTGGTAAGPATPAISRAPQAPPAGTGGGHGESLRNVAIMLAAGAAAVGVAGSVLVWRGLRGKDHA